MRIDAENIVKIHSGNRPWYELLLASIFYAVTIYTIINLIYNSFFITDSEYYPIKYLFDFLIYGVPSLAFGLRYSMVKDVYIDLNQNTILSIYIVGPFSKKTNTLVQNFEYVSVFKNDNDIYETNLWHQGNKHYKMYDFYAKKDAFTFGLLISDKLKIDLLDATNRGNNQWVDKSKGTEI